MARPEAPTFTAPGRYGAPQQIFNTGQGRFTRPRYRYGATFSVGFDDNVFQTPDNSTGVPQQEFRQVIPAQPEITQTVTERQFVGLRPFNSKFIPVFRTVTREVVIRPAVPEQEIVQVIPGVEPSERIESVVSGVSANFDVQWAKSRSLFTFDLRAGADYYWNRTDDPLDYNGNLSLVYVRRYGPRIQFSASANASYSSQPDFSNVNVNSNSQGEYFTASSKLDLEYRWSPRFTTDTSFSLDTINYLEEARSTSNYWSTTLGNEFRYRWSPRITAILEGRYSILRYYESESEAGNSNTIFLLLGAEWIFSRRFRGTARFGESIRTFDESGISRATPYGELSLIYQPSRRSQLSASARYGFENTTLPTDETITLRGSLSYNHAFSPRLSAGCSIFYVKNDTTSGAGTAIETNSTNETYDGTLNLTYLFTRKFSMSARYSYTLREAAFNLGYDRSRFFLTGEYNF